MIGFDGEIVITSFIISNQEVMWPGQLPPPAAVCQDTVDLIITEKESY